MTTINKLGSTVRLNGVLLVDDIPTDPDSLRLEIEDPTGGVTEFILGVDPEIVVNGVGRFYYDLQLTMRGSWLFRWFSNGSLTAFNHGQVDAAFEVVVTTRSEDGNPIPFASFRVMTGEGEEVYDLVNDRTASNGEAPIELMPGNYRIVAAKLGWIFAPTLVDVTESGSVIVEAHPVRSRWLTWEDLEGIVDRATIDRLFDDKTSGHRDMILVESSIQQAEAMAESLLLRNWSLDQVVALARNDSAVRAQAAWLALEFASERRSEFLSDDGKGRYWAQYERAMSFFDKLGKSLVHSRGEAQATTGANSGGAIRPVVPANQEPHIFAPGRGGRGPGGF